MNDIAILAVLRRLLLLLLLVPLAGCGAPVVLQASHKDAVYNQKLQRVLIVVDLYWASMSDTQQTALVRPEELRKAFTTKWGPHGVSIDIVDLNTADTKAEKTAMLNAAVERTRPLQILELKTLRYTLYQTMLDGYTVGINLYDADHRKIVWSTIVEYTPFGYGGRARMGAFGVYPKPHQDDANEFVDLLTARLKTDGLL